MNLAKAVRASLALLDRRDRRLLGLAAGLQIATAVLDLLGVSLIGLVGVLSMATVQEQPPPGFVLKIVAALGIEGLSGPTLLAVLAAAAVVLLLTKNVVSPILVARVFAFLARRQAFVSARLSKELLARPITFVHRRSSQETATALISGASAAMSVLGQSLLAISEMALLILLSASLLFVDAGAALGAIVFFTVFGTALQKILGNRIAHVSAEILKADIASYRAVQEAMGAYREICVSDRRLLYVDRIQALRGQSAENTAHLQTYSMLPKYASEGALVVGAFSLGAFLFVTKPVAVAAGTFALFLAAGARVMPSLLRLANAALNIRSGAASATPTFELADDLGNPREIPLDAERQEAIERSLQSRRRDFVPRIEMRDVSLTYPEGHSAALQGISLVVEQGQCVALVGRSGAGKSTLADVILGVLAPDEGTVTLGNLRPTEAIQRWPGGIAYVPQEVTLVNDTIRANIALGIPGDHINDDLVWDALSRAYLEDYVRHQPEALDTQVGERGLRISGGQRQRLGIARALFTRPQLIVLDEATSALDAETEHAITTMLAELDEDVTTVIIAHRLSTIRHADLVVYMEEGKALTSGSFDEVCARIPALQRQAGLMGLRTD